jgi:monoamine oxidase
MSRTTLMAQLMRLARLSAHCEATGQSAQEAIERAAEQGEGLGDAGRRRFAQGATAAAAVAATGAMAPGAFAKVGAIRTAWKRATTTENVAVVGAGLAGLSAATELARRGIAARVFEADNRVGGRVHSVRGVFPGQVAKLGGEFIGTSHHMMLGYARMLGLTLEDASLFPGSRYFDFGGQRYTEAQMVEEFRGFAASMRQDLGTLGTPTADRFTEAESLYDYMSLDDYLILHGAGDRLRKLVGAAYATEYGTGIDQTSALSFLRFAHADKRSKFAAFGAQADVHLHIVEGTDRIATGLAERLPVPPTLGHRLVAIHKRANGKIRLTFDVAGKSVQSEHDAVVMTLPFTVLRRIHLDSSLGLPAWKRFAINSAVAGDNSKLMVGFKQSFWYTRHGLNGSGYSDRPGLQATWETNAIKGGAEGGILTRYLGGQAARTQDDRRQQSNANRFLRDLEAVLPGALNAARRDGNGHLVTAGANWSTNPLSRGSYASTRPGYFTTAAHHEAKPIGNLMFAGDHTSSFYEWQGCMEGAALSGLRAAGEVFGFLRTR